MDTGISARIIATRGYEYRLQFRLALFRYLRSAGGFSFQCVPGGHSPCMSRSRVCPFIGSFWGLLKEKAERSFRVRDCNSHLSANPVHPSKSTASLRPQISTSQEEFLLFFRNFMLVFTAAMQLHRMGNDDFMASRRHPRKSTEVCCL
jgi:hypothetical protein